MNLHLVTSQVTSTAENMEDGEYRNTWWNQWLGIVKPSPHMGFL